MFPGIKRFQGRWKMQRVRQADYDGLESRISQHLIVVRKEALGSVLGRESLPPRFIQIAGCIEFSELTSLNSFGVSLPRPTQTHESDIYFVHPLVSQRRGRRQRRERATTERAHHEHGHYATMFPGSPRPRERGSAPRLRPMLRGTAAVALYFSVAGLIFAVLLSKQE
jgi:hypothetical protein